MNGHSNYCKLEPDGECYKHFKGPLTYTNASNNFLVIVGANPSDTDADNELIAVSDGTDQIDHFFIARFDRDVTAAGATTTVVQKGIPRRMLVPPNGVVTGTGGGFLSLVECCCLEKALAIL